MANVVFTLGSTGAPKEVAVEHRSVANLVRGQLDKLHNQSCDEGRKKLVGTQRVGVGFGFDPLALELWLVLCTGGTLHDVPDAVKYEATTLGAGMGVWDVNYAVIPVALLPLAEPPTVASLQHNHMTAVTGRSDADATEEYIWAPWILVMGGVGVAQGYANTAEEIARRFVITGDVCR